MYFPGPLDGFTASALALAVILSAIMSLAGTAGRRRVIEAGEARAQDLAEMTGITDGMELLETFGPPDMGRVWRSVTLFDVRRARRPLGWLISSDIIDWFCIAIGVLAFISSHALIQMALILAVVMQTGAWLAAARMPK